MKYKNIYSAIHNFGTSFTSLMNYVDEDYVIDELVKIHGKGEDVEVNWLTREFKPENLITPRIEKSIVYWGDSLEKHLSSQNVELAKLQSLYFRWPARKRKFMLALDDRGKEYKIYVNESK
ncbi:hypothetical protein HHE94_01785 [Pseudoalteromonas arctica]|uniref:Uncharacterized protein n=1 Tax=Pseudoalteromonas arctica TaxID=394751 RepID=A0AAP6XZZ0_9GAMM|nr:hypothetical protein [Pseudoalteromonas arctica]NMP01457.1 hypothetical protein [Pseudoalteromonas arctica]